jgi:hypothetical protein
MIEVKYENGLKKDITKESYQFKKERYVVLRDIIPKDMIKFVYDCWLRWEKSDKLSQVIKPEEDIIFNSPEDTLNRSSAVFENAPWSVALQQYLKPKLEDIIDVELIPTYAYTRKYERNAFLKAHNDRPSCEFSVTLPIAYFTDDHKPWKIWVKNDKDYIGVKDDRYISSITQDIPIRERKDIGVELEPGDILVYQGPNVLHWRDRLVGKHSYNIFLHYITYNNDIYKKYGDIYKFDNRESIYHDYERSKEKQREDTDSYVESLPEYPQMINNYLKFKREV